jgi:hypothetical protein
VTSYGTRRFGKYKTESIEAETKLIEITPEMFSRAIHFDEEILDSVLVVENKGVDFADVPDFDSLVVARIDSARRIE